MLGDHSGKSYQTFVRGRVLPKFLDIACETQCGGLPRRGTDFASHIARAYLDVQKAMKRSAFGLFLACGTVIRCDELQRLEGTATSSVILICGPETRKHQNDSSLYP